MKQSTALRKCRGIALTIKRNQPEIINQLFPDFRDQDKRRNRIKRYIAKYNLNTREFSSILFTKDIEWISKEKVLNGHKLGVE